MQIVQPTTPFGRRPMSLAVVAAQVVAAETPPDAAAHKWQVFRAVCEARPILGVSERSLTVLNALLTFHPETALTTSDGCGLVVFPSNMQLSLRAHGMAPATLRRHLAVLVEAGLIIRRDSPNGKRFSRKGAGGSIETAYGFDLTPLVSRAGEFENLAQQVRAERRELASHREAFTILRRDVSKMIEAALTAGISADWTAIHETLRSIVSTVPRSPLLTDLKGAIEALVLMSRDLRFLLEDLVKSENMSATESQDERHKQNSNLENIKIPEPAFREGRTPPPVANDSDLSLVRKPFPLSMVLGACPDIADYAKGGVSTWRDMITAAELVRTMLGISPSAWQDAVDVMGLHNAATTIGIILQKGEAVRSAGGYLRSLVDKARIGSFSLGPPLMALVGTSRPSSRRAS